MFFDPITKCRKCEKMFANADGLHGYELCNRCAVWVGKIAEEQLAWVEGLAAITPDEESTCSLQT